jgi:hypothetical protein
MSDKKRTTVTTIETHEVWIIRRAVPELAEEAVTLPPLKTTQPAPVPPLYELDDGTEINYPNKKEES